MLKLLLWPTELILAAAFLRAGPARRAEAKETSPPRDIVQGIYAAGTKRLPSSGRDGCWLEAAPAGANSIHIQILCRYPAPGHHLGALDARLPLHGDTLVYERRESQEECRIRVRFAGARAVVTQDGSSVACGFGAYVDVSGRYLRLNGRRPSFDLFPIERPRTRSGQAAG